MEVEFNHLNHATWECKYHVVFTPKYRKKLLFGQIRRHCAECRTQDAEFPRPQILGARIFCHDRWPG